MATAPAASRPALTWHPRGTWSTREDRIPSAVWLGVLWLGMIAGFGVDIARFVHEHPPAPPVVYVHATVFTGWMLLLTAQVLLVVGNRVAWHRKLGWVAAGWACLMAVLGPWAALSSLAVNLNLPAGDTPFFSVNVVDIGGFLVLLVWGLTLRTNPAAHKRMMILATVSLADPGFSRFSGWLWPQEPASLIAWFLWVFYGNVLLVALMAAWDWRKRRLMPQFVVGGIGLVAAEFAATLLYFWEPWRMLTVHWVHSWAKLGV